MSVNPALTLWADFANDRSLVSRIGPTFGCVRALNTASRFNGAGVMETGILANAARFDHDPVTGKSLGLLVEEARTNLALRSGNLFTAPWTSIQTPGITANSAISPRGLLEVTLFTDNNATNREGVQQSVVVPNNTATHASSVFVRKTTGAISPTFGLEMVYAGGTGTVPVQIRLNTDTGETNGVGGGGAQDFGDYWRLWGISTNNGTGNTTLLVKVFPALAAHGSFVDVASTIGFAHAWGCQAEFGSTPTSYIETLEAAVLRNADRISTTDLSWLNPAEGTLLTDIIVPPLPQTGTGTPFIIAIDDGSAVDRILHTLLRKATDFDSRLFITDGGNNFVITNDPTDTVEGERLRMASAWSANDSALSVNGKAALLDVTVTIPTELTILRLDAPAGIAQSNGHMCEIRYYNVGGDKQLLEDLTNGVISEIFDERMALVHGGISGFVQN